MRYLILILVYTFFNLSVKAQCDSSLIGIWKPISVSTEELYYNFLKDSASVPKDINTSYLDSATRSHMTEMIKFMFTDLRYIFKKDSSFEIILMEDMKFQGKYCFCNEKSILKITSENGIGQLVTDTLKASIHKGIFFIRMSLQDEDFFEFNLQRENADPITGNNDKKNTLNTSHTNQTAHAQFSTSLFLYTLKVQRQPAHVSFPLTISNSRSF